jgi:hypothetical protein
VGKRKKGGNPLTKGLSRLINEASDKVGGEVLDGVLEVATGSSSKKKTSKASDRSTDWATRAPAAPRKRRSS